MNRRVLQQLPHGPHVRRSAAEREFDAAFTSFVAQKADGLVVGASPLFNSRRDRLIALAARWLSCWP